MNKKILQKVAKNIKKFRKAKKLKQDDFSAVEGISRSTIAMLETVRTDVTVSKLKIIADVLEVKLRDLFDFDE